MALKTKSWKELVCAHFLEMPSTRLFKYVAVAGCGHINNILMYNMPRVWMCGLMDGHGGRV